MIYPVDKSKKAQKERADYGVIPNFHPDFEVDALLYVPQGLGEDIPEIPIRMEAEPYDEEGGRDSPMFLLRVRESSLPGEHPVSGHVWRAPKQHVNNGGYWISVEKLGSGNVERDNMGAPPDDWGVVLPKSSIHAMLVWYDRFLEQGSPATHVERRLIEAGLEYQQERTGGADWSVNSAWALGNNVYLVEEDNDDLWSLVRRDMASEDDEITELAGPDTLEEMITRAPRFL